MNSLITFALTLVENAAVRHIRQPIARMAYVVTFALMAIGCAIAGIGCGLAALWIYALPHVGAVGAPLVVSGVLLAMSLVMLMVARYTSGARSAPPKDPDLESVISEAMKLLKEHKNSVLLATFLTGLIAGKRKT